MRRRNQSGPGLATALNASGNVETAHINRNGHETTTRKSEDISRQAVSRLFDPYSAARVEESAGRDIQCLLRAADDHDLLGFAAE